MRWFGLGVVACTVGCVSVRHEVQVQPFGAYQSDLELQQSANRTPASEASGVKVYVGSLPPGMEIQDGKPVLAPGLEILGTVSTNYTNADAFSSWMFGGFYKMPEHQKALQTYCSVQSPLVWVTLTMWNYLPFRYPCIPSGGNGTKAVAKRKDAIIQAMQKGAVALGGDVVVVVELGDIKYVQAGTDRVVGGLDMTQGAGLIVRLPE